VSQRSRTSRRRRAGPAGHSPARPHERLTVWPATAICGNDITSSCLYVSALAIVAAGRLAWLALLIVAGVLYLFRGVYAEAVGALPMNGGAYNTLLNTTSKFRASIAAALTILSYMATAVISGIEGMHYVSLVAPSSAMDGLDGLVHAVVPIFDGHGGVVLLTVLVLAAFAALTILGITESSRVALAIFVFHLTTLGVLAVAATAWLVVEGGGHWGSNWALQLPEGRGFASAVFFGFAAAMLGISGFESSANFVEEQADGVFPLTLRNMWLAVSVFNPLMAVLALCLVPIPEVSEHSESLLAHVGSIAGGESLGPWLERVIAVDAVLVLSGAVLTSFIGVNGLVYRMTLDRCLPQWLLKKSRRGTPYRITILFFLAGVSVLVITRGDVASLAGVYTISFLAVMALFAIGNMLLKIRRARLPRPSRASWPAVTLALVAVLAGIAGNVAAHPDDFLIFLAYFVPTMVVIIAMLKRTQLLAAGLAVLRAGAGAIIRVHRRANHRIRALIRLIESQSMVFFTRGDHVSNLNRAILYIRANEHTSRVRVVIAALEDADVPERLPKDVQFLNETYPDMGITLHVVRAEFGPKLLQQLSDEWDVPLNFMFIGSPGDRFPHELSDLGGVRLII
jgi:amino acid transporter